MKLANIFRLGVALAALPTLAHAAPAGAGPILNAVSWVRDTLLGEVASGVAVVAVAVVGFMMWSWLSAVIVLASVDAHGKVLLVAGVTADQTARVKAGANDVERLVWTLPADFLVLADTWDKAHPGTPPALMGQLFHYFEAPNRFGLPAFYTLHVWAWKDNPNGAFVNWHPNVSCKSFTPDSNQ